MNKAELVEKVAKTVNATKTDVERIISETIYSIKEAVKSGDSVKLIGFGTFTKVHRKERMGQNPKTREKIKIAACDVPKFKPGKEFKEMVN